MAVVDPTAGGNPRQLNEADALELYDRAIEGGWGKRPAMPQVGKGLRGFVRRTIHAQRMHNACT